MPLLPGIKERFHGRLKVRRVPGNQGQTVDLRRGGNKRIRGLNRPAASFAVGYQSAPFIGNRPIYIG